MFGENPIRKQDHGDGTSLRVQAVFPTIQGEGPFVGTPAVFVRLAGCNLRCRFCDTDFESNYGDLRRVEPLAAEVLAHAHALRTGLVVITGGEPLRQNVEPLLCLLIASNLHIQFETAGTLWVQGLDRYLHSDWRTYPLAGASIVTSPKTGVVHPQIRKWTAAWKYIIRVGETSREDGLPIISPQTGLVMTMARPDNTVPPHEIFLQPCEEYLDSYSESGARCTNSVKTAENMVLCSQLARQFGYRVSLQTHKILGIE